MRDLAREQDRLEAEEFVRQAIEGLSGGLRGAGARPRPPERGKEGSS